MKSPENPVSIEQRLGKPDYLGNWEGFGNGDFRMYLLRRMPREGNGQYGEFIEGVIIDKIGISVFSGTVEGNGTDMYKKSIRFAKIYSQGARAEGGFDWIDYEGEFDTESGICKGKYTVPGTELSGEFQLTESS